MTNFARMNGLTIIWLLLTLAMLNAGMYWLLQKFLLRRPDPAMRFLAINIAKDIFWCGVWISVLDHTRANFLALVLVFIVLSAFLYALAVRRINEI